MSAPRKKSGKGRSDTNMAKLKKKIAITISALAILILGAAFFIALLNLIGGKYYLEQTYRQAMSGKWHLENARDAVYSNDWTQAEAESTLAQVAFSQALSDWESFSQKRLASSVLPSLNKKSIQATGNFLATAEILSRSAQQASQIAKGAQEIFDFRSLSFQDMDNSKRQAAIRYLYESLPEINGLAANLQLAQLTLEKGQDSLIALPFREKIAWLDSQLSYANSIMADAKLLVQTTPLLAGYPQESRFLVILQNDDELRPSGGFIGSYAIITVRDGLLTSMDSHDSYHVDMPAVGLLRKEPPAPIKKYMEVENWYLRDANWSPDWPTSARQIIQNYNDEREVTGNEREKFDAVIGITPELVASFLRITGNINVQGVEYTPENFQEQLQYEVEVGYKEQDISSWQRKEVIDEVMAVLVDRVTRLPKDKWLEVAAVLQRAREKKDLLAYFPDPTYQSLAKLLAVDGEIEKTDSDYLMVVDANLAAFKTDAVMDKEISYLVREEGGHLKATVTLRYSHNGGFDWRTTRYRTYTRLYVPAGSELIRAEGYKDGVDQTGEPLLEKTSFGFFFTVEPSEQDKTVTIEYQLPQYIYEQYLVGEYNLFIQKQPGNHITNFEVLTPKGNKTLAPLEKDEGIFF